MTVFFILIISFVASLVRSTFGFGESLVAVPLFLLFLPGTIAVPLSVLLSVIVALIVIIQDHKKVHIRSAKWLLLYAIPGIPVGIFILTVSNETFVKVLLGTIIILYSVYSLFVKTLEVLPRHPRWLLFICGFLSGVFGGAYGLNGPPLVIYGNLKKWSAGRFRATLQAYFLPASFLSVVGYFIEGLMTQEVETYFLIALSSTIPAVFLGRFLNRRLKNNFFKYIYIGLIILGLILILGSLN